LAATFNREITLKRRSGASPDRAEKRDPVWRDCALDSRRQRPIVSGLIENDSQYSILAEIPVTNTASPYFFYSAGILFREGLEALLVIVALLAGIGSTGTSKTRSIYIGALIAVAASLTLAWVVYDLIGDNASDTLEGVFQIFAAATLVYVSSWLTSTAQADRWNQFISARAERAERSGLPSIALGLTAFLAVMREGAETVVFFQALMAGATERIEKHAIAAGIGIAAVGLAVSFLALRKAAVRIPIGAFFASTSILLYALAVIFVGQGVASLQEAGVVSATFVSHAPTISVLGIYPTVQSLVAQSALLIFAAAAVLRPSAADQPALLSPPQRPGEKIEERRRLLAGRRE
jgi:FTR1 family protein